MRCIRWVGGWNGYAACIVDDDGLNKRSGEYGSEWGIYIRKTDEEEE